MGRIPRIVSNSLTGVSLLLCAATVILWVRSFWAVDVLRRDERVLMLLFSERGTLGLGYHDRAGRVSPNYQFQGWVYSAGEASHTIAGRRGRLRGTILHFDRLGFAIHYGRRPDPSSTATPGPSIADRVMLRVKVPHWFLAACCAIRPMVAFRRQSRQSDRGFPLDTVEPAQQGNPQTQTETKSGEV